MSRNDGRERFDQEECDANAAVALDLIRQGERYLHHGNIIKTVSKGEPCGSGVFSESAARSHNDLMKKRFNDFLGRKLVASIEKLARKECFGTSLANLRCHPLGKKHVEDWGKRIPTINQILKKVKREFGWEEKFMPPEGSTEERKLAVAVLRYCLKMKSGAGKTKALYVMLPDEMIRRDENGDIIMHPYYLAKQFQKYDMGKRSAEKPAHEIEEDAKASGIISSDVLKKLQFLREEEKKQRAEEKQEQEMKQKQKKIS